MTDDPINEQPAPVPTALLLLGPFHGHTRAADGPVIVVIDLGFDPCRYEATGYVLPDGRAVYQYEAGTPGRGRKHHA